METGGRMGNASLAEVTGASQGSSCCIPKPFNAKMLRPTMTRSKMHFSRCSFMSKEGGR